MKLLEIKTLLTISLTVFGMVSAISAQEKDSGKIVAIAKVKAPAAATESILKQGFIKAIPTYQNIEGLQVKAFSIQKTEAGTFFGGIYLGVGVAIAMDTVGEFYISRFFSRPSHDILVCSRGFFSNQSTLLPMLIAEAVAKL